MLEFYKENIKTNKELLYKYIKTFSSLRINHSLKLVAFSLKMSKIVFWEVSQDREKIDLLI